MKMLKTLAILGLFGVATTLSAETLQTHRVPKLSNDKVNVWEAVIYPSKSQQLKMHRHEYNRVLYALTDGTLKIENDKGQSHVLKLQKGKAYYLTKDVSNELHIDENIGKQPIKVIVIELK